MPVPDLRATAVQALRRVTVVRFARRHLDGLSGVEIGGAAHADFGVDVVNVDRYPSEDTVYKDEERRVTGRVRPIDVVASGDDLPFPDDSYDFVLASHVIEHFPDPIRALEEWRRVARRHLFLVVPHRDRTFDRDRPLTPLAELIARHEAGLVSDEDKHWSVWTCESFVELCDHLGLEVVARRDPDVPRGNGFALLLSV